MGVSRLRQSWENFACVAFIYFYFFSREATNIFPFPFHLFIFFLLAFGLVFTCCEKKKKKRGKHRKHTWLPSRRTPSSGRDMSSSVTSIHHTPADSKLWSRTWRVMRLWCKHVYVSSLIPNVNFINASSPPRCHESSRTHSSGSSSSHKHSTVVFSSWLPSCDPLPGVETLVSRAIDYPHTQRRFHQWVPPSFLPNIWLTHKQIRHVSNTFYMWLMDDMKKFISY